MRKVVVALLALAVVYVVVDLGARAYAEGEIESRAAARVESAAGVEASIRSFPFLGRLAVSGEVGEMTIRADEIGGERLTLVNIEVELRGVAVDRGELFGDRRVQVVGLDSGTARFELTGAAVSEALGVPIRISGGRVEAMVGGRRVPVSVSLAGGTTLRLTAAAGATLSVPIPRTDLVPCAPRVSVADDRIRLSCTFREVPPALLRAAQDSARRARVTPPSSKWGTPGA